MGTVKSPLKKKKRILYERCSSVMCQVFVSHSQAEDRPRGLAAGLELEERGCFFLRVKPVFEIFSPQVLPTEATKQTLCLRFAPLRKTISNHWSAIINTGAGLQHRSGLCLQAFGKTFWGEGNCAYLVLFVKLQCRKMMTGALMLCFALCVDFLHISCFRLFPETDQYHCPCTPSFLPLGNSVLNSC